MLSYYKNKRKNPFDVSFSLWFSTETHEKGGNDTCTQGIIAYNDFIYLHFYSTFANVSLFKRKKWQIGFTSQFSV